MNECVICGKECKGDCCSGACRAKKSRRTRTKNRPNYPEIRENRISGYVYLIHCIGFPYYKIGLTTAKTPNERLQALQIGLPFELELVRAVSVSNVNQAEQYLHKRYQANNIRGEWFNFNDNELDGVKAKYEHLALFYKMIA